MLVFRGLPPPPVLYFAAQLSRACRMWTCQSSRSHCGGTWQTRTTNKNKPWGTPLLRIASRSFACRSGLGRGLGSCLCTESRCKPHGLAPYIATQLKCRVRASAVLENEAGATQCEQARQQLSALAFRGGNGLPRITAIRSTARGEWRSLNVVAESVCVVVVVAERGRGQRWAGAYSPAVGAWRRHT